MNKFLRYITFKPLPNEEFTYFLKDYKGQLKGEIYEVRGRKIITIKGEIK